MKKKTLVLFLAAAMACSALTGCGNSSEETAPAVTDVSEGQTEEEPEDDAFYDEDSDDDTPDDDLKDFVVIDEEEEN